MHSCIIWLFESSFCGNDLWVQFGEGVEISNKENLPISESLGGKRPILHLLKRKSEQIPIQILASGRSIQEEKRRVQSVFLNM